MKLMVSLLAATLIGVGWLVYVERNDISGCRASKCERGAPVHFEEGCFCVERPASR